MKPRDETIKGQGMAQDPIEDFKDPLRVLLEQIEELVRVVKNSQFSDDAIPPMVLDRISYLEGLASAMIEANEATSQAVGVSEQSISAALEKMQEAASENKRIIERLNSVKKEVTAMQQTFSIAKTIATQHKKQKGKQKVIARKKKFRKMGGGGKGWQSV